jgi:hypothetical protein
VPELSREKFKKPPAQLLPVKYATGAAAHSRLNSSSAIGMQGILRALNVAKLLGSFCVVFLCVLVGDCGNGQT